MFCAGEIYLWYCQLISVCPSPNTIHLKHSYKSMSQYEKEFGRKSSNVKNGVPNIPNCVHSIPIIWFAATHTDRVPIPNYPHFNCPVGIGWYYTDIGPTLQLPTLLLPTPLLPTLIEFPTTLTSTTHTDTTHSSY